MNSTGIRNSKQIPRLVSLFTRGNATKVHIRRSTYVRKQENRKFALFEVRRTPRFVTRFAPSQRNIVVASVARHRGGTEDGGINTC